LAQTLKFRSGRKNARQVAAIDIGASKVACMIARLESEPGYPLQAEIIGVGHHGSPVRPREAANIEQIERGLRSALDTAERMAGQQVRRVSVAVPGKFLRTRRIGVDVDISGGLITEEDVEDSLAEGASIVAADGCTALHAVPTAYRVDGEEFVADPVGLHASLLSTEMLGVAARQSVLDHLASMVERCGLVVEEFIAAPFAAAEATLLEDEKDLGVVMVDIGSASTGYAVYDNGVLVDCGGVSVGGGHITKDIAQIFGAPLAQAERIKTLHGAALFGPGDEHRFIDYPEVGVTKELSRVSRADLCEVIIPRVEEIFELVAEKLPDDGMRRSGLRRAVITGGGSLLVGAREIAERTLSMKSRLGRPILIAGAPEAAGGPGYSVCAGVIQNVINSGGERHSGLGVSGQSAHSNMQASFLGGMHAWLRAKF